jgi:redox-sensitive bicupin YhaK (pirin superfamily)
MGTGSVITPGDVQRMSAGTGVLHSEMNPSKADAVHFLQIWLLPERHGLEPSYEQKRFEAADKQGRLRLVGARDARDGAVTIHQDVDLYAGVFTPGDGARFELRPGRHAWIQVARGAVVVNGQPLAQGDGAAVSDEAAVELRATVDAEILVFDLA